MNERWDLVIVGASCAGFSAAVYAARRRLRFKVIGADLGGEMALSGEIENWPAVVHTTGIELTDKFKEQMRANSVLIEEDARVVEIRKEGPVWVLRGTKNGGTFEEHARTVIIATGVHPRELNIPGEKEFRGKGVTYCTVCDGPLFAGKTVVTIGGGNSALESAIMLSAIGKKVFVINKNPQFKGDEVLIEKVTKDLTTKNVEVIYGALTSKIVGETFVTGVEYKDLSGEMKTIAAEGVFVHIGMIPNSTFTPADLAKNEFGEIIVDTASRTNLPGLFAAGDVTNISYKQLAIAAGQGVAAALSAVDYLNKLRD
jgi:alkyl hydroperoxide reductase subunit F